MENKYIITQDQLEIIEHFQRMFDLHSGYIKDLCGSEKDDIVYGFELGKMYNSMREHYMDMMTLTTNIKTQIKK